MAQDAALCQRRSQTGIQLPVRVARAHLLLLLMVAAPMVNAAQPATTQPPAPQAEPDGTTALHRAVYAGDVAAARKLIAGGADARAANLFGATPLMLAATAGNAEMIKLLLDAGAPANEANEEGQTPLMAVARTGNVEAAKLLLARGAKVGASEHWGGQTALTSMRTAPCVTGSAA